MSGVDWPGAPGVRQLPFRRVFSPLKRPVPRDAEIVTAYTDGQVTLRSNRSKVGYHEAADLSGFQGVRVGDFVVHGLDIMRGSLGVSDSSGAISSVCTVCTPLLHVDLRYVAYVLRQMAISGYPKALARGVREGGADFRRWDTLGSLPVPLLDSGLQTKVADYLDLETAEIDASIADQEELIGLLEERRVATLVTDVVGRGLRAVQYKESGSWLGELPADWPLGRVGMAYDLTLGKTVDASKQDGELVPYLRAANVQERGVDVGDRAMLRATIDEQRRLTLRAGDVVIVEGGGGYGRSDYLEEGLDGWIFQNHVIRARPRGSEDGRYLDLLIKAARALGVFASDGSYATIPNLSAEKLGRLAFPRVPIEVQRQIIQRVSDEVGPIMKSVTDAREAIALSKERRAALISAAVTGQIDVTERKRVLV